MNWDKHCEIGDKAMKNFLGAGWVSLVPVSSILGIVKEEVVNVRSDGTGVTVSQIRTQDYEEAGGSHDSC